MFGPKASAPAKPVTKNTVGDGLAPIKYAIAVSTVWTGLLLLGCYLLWVMLPGRYLLQQGTKQELSSYAGLVQLKIASYQRQLDSLALPENQSNEIGAADNAYLEQWFQRFLPEAAAVRVLNPTLMVPDDAEQPIITNATIENIGNALEGKLVGPEIIRPGQAGQHLLLIRVLRDAQGQPLKVVVAGFEPSQFNQVLSSLPAWGYVELLQVFGQNQSLLAKYGDVQYRDGEPETLTLPQTPWRLQYWPQKQRWALELGAVAWLPVLILALLILLSQLLGFWELRRRLRLDGRHFEQALDMAWQKGQTSTTDGWQLGLFQTLLKRLNTLVMERTHKIRLEPTTSLVAMSPPEQELPATESPLNQVSAGFLPVHLADVTEGEPRVPASMFRAYDIRGVVGTQLTEEVAYLVGKAVGSEAFEQGEQGVVVARDGRLSSKALTDALIRGLLESGCDVVDLGEAPTPLLYYATHQLSTSSGVMVTGSHNPAEYNGFKVVLSGQALLEEQLQQLYQRIQQHRFNEGAGVRTELDLSSTYLSEITGDVVLARSLKIVVDAGNGIAGKLAPTLFETLGCQVIALHCDLDGNFPHHAPDPGNPANLAELKERVLLEQADLGIAFDGDGDRLAVIDSRGKIIWPDRQMMLFAIDMLSRNPGADVVFDVKCSRHLANIVSSHGGRPILCKTGHSWIKAKQRETGALLAGEGSGHIMFKERWYGFDDGLYAAARLLEILSADVRSPAEIFAELPEAEITPELLIPFDDLAKFALIDRLKQHGDFGDGERIELDGIRVEYLDGWGLIRCSNTSPALIARFEAESPPALARIQNQFREQLLKLEPELALPF